MSIENQRMIEKFWEAMKTNDHFSRCAMGGFGGWWSTGLMHTQHRSGGRNGLSGYRGRIVTGGDDSGFGSREGAPPLVLHLCRGPVLPQ
jgi:hypothetical protein